MLLPQDTSGVLRDVEITVDLPNISEREAIPATFIVPFNVYLYPKVVFTFLYQNTSAIIIYNY